MTVLFIADIVGEPGINIVLDQISHLKEEHNVDFCIANGENASRGKGITKTIVNQLVDNGINAITSGNHIWEKQQFAKHMEKFTMVLRPANYPEGNAGYGYSIHTIGSDTKLAVLNLQGRTYLPSIDCPFRTAEKIIKELRRETKNIIIDMHAEATAEKLAFAHFVDGKVSAVIGTHTHVQTADEKILKKGTAYITDVGMTGPADSVIGLNKKIAINRFIYQIPIRYQIAEGNARLDGVILKINPKSGKGHSIKRISVENTEKTG
ncbi:MAG: TIGR00282 family metallophosphoesterase [bacterium]|nr:TIGR00282 family metallophosphoesterase [bacterium]